VGIEGTWYNELGSMMEISVNGASISGTYWTAVGNASGRYALVGQINTSPNAGGQAVAWTVVWNNQSGSSNSVTAWSGQYQTIQGSEEIYTFWTLTSELDPDEDWQAANIGQDTFTRNAPNPQQIERALKQRSLSVPKSSLK
jgi:hypothetical protein